MVSATGLGGSKSPGLSRGGGEEAQKSELCRKAESRAGEPCCQSNMDELESGKSWVQIPHELKDTLSSVLTSMLKVHFSTELT